MLSHQILVLTLRLEDDVTKNREMERAFRPFLKLS